MQALVFRPLFQLKVPSFAFLILLTLPFSRVARAALTADEIVLKADEARSPIEDFSMNTQITDVQKTDRKVNLYRVSSKGNKFALVEQKAPERLQGRKLLMHDHDLWLFSPNVSRPTRISFEQKLTGEVANGDIVRTNFAGDYSAQLVGEEKLPAGDAYKIHLLAREKTVTYRSIDYWVLKANLRPLKAIFYALSGKALKSAAYSDFKPVFGKPRMSKVIVTDALQTGRTSEITYSGFKKENYDESFFNKERLGQ
jgi:hypothetical protein